MASEAVGISGELDLATASQLERTVNEAELNAPLVVLDMRELATCCEPSEAPECCSDEPGEKGCGCM